jgi:CheY-like chemotaxis protein
MRALDSQLRFLVKVDSKLPKALFGDETRIRQILLNLLNNAVKFTEKGFVSLSIDGEKTAENTINLIIEVTDTGIGIKKDDIEIIFDAYSQSEHVKSKNIEGTGLGLAITQNIINSMNGSIKVNSEYGKGSIFTVILPQLIRSGEALVTVERPEEKSILFYERRSLYTESFVHAADNLGLHYASVSSDEEFYKALLKEHWPYVFIAAGLYKNIVPIVQTAGAASKTVLLTEFGEPIPDNRLSILPMPMCSLFIANVLNGISYSYAYGENIKSVATFTAPETKILIVDDVRTNLKVAKGLLAPYKVQMDLCTSGVKALNAIRTTHFDIIFMDHKMPEMDGIETTQRIRAMGEKDPYYSSVPIIALTANVVLGMKELFMETGFSDFLSKPIDTVELNTILKKWIPPEKQQDKTAENSGVTIADKQDAGMFIQIEGLDQDKGILISGGTIESYLDTLGIFYWDGLERIREINTSLEKGVLSQYIIHIHALKSACANIGADKLSETAKELEMAAERGELKYLEKHNAPFLSELESLLNNINDTVKTNQKAGKEMPEGMDTKTFNDRLVKLKTALETLDVATINKTMDSLLAMQKTEDAGAAVKNISENIFMAEYDIAIELIDELLP